MWQGARSRAGTQELEDSHWNRGGDEARDGMHILVRETRLAMQSFAQEGEIWKRQRPAGTPLR